MRIIINSLLLTCLISSLPAIGQESKLDPIDKTFGKIDLSKVAKVGENKDNNTQSLFLPDLSNATYSKDVWSVDQDGVLSVTADQAIWTTSQYENFELSLEFKNDHGTNSGVIIYCTDTKNWIPHAIEIQIADDYFEKFQSWSKDWLCGAVFGHLAPTETKIVKPAGEWNTMKITAKGQHLVVELNGVKTADMDLKRWTSGTENPDGTKIPAWMPTPFAQLPTKGYIGLQGKHGNATIWFRNITIKN